MDPLSLSCNIIAVLSLTSKLLAAGYTYGGAVKGFPSDLRELIGELSSLSGILQALKVTIEPSEENEPAMAIITASKPDPTAIARAIAIPLEDCRTMLAEMVQNLEKYQTSGSRIEKITKRLTWPLKEDETRDWVEKLGRYKSTFTLALSADGLALTRTIYNDLGEIKALQIIESQRNDNAEKERHLLTVLDWISPAIAEINHSTAQRFQQSGTGRWFTEGKTFHDWLNRENSFLWLYGIPGSGKTILSSIIIDRIVSEVNTDTTVTYFYFDFKEPVKRTTLGFLGSIAAQLVQRKTPTLQMLEPLYDKYSQNKRLSDVWGLETCLHQIIKQFSKVIVVIDALDECVERANLFHVLERLQNLTNLSLLITSRDEGDIKLQFACLPSLKINRDDVSVDIENFVKHELQRQPRLTRLKPAIKSDITESLVRGAKGMFRWAKCCLDQIAKLRNDRAIKTALESLPPTLEESYERILCGIPIEDKPIAIRLFQWLIFSRRPMTIMEVGDGIAVEDGDDFLDPENKLNDLGDILDICGGLVELDEKRFTLGLAHFTVKEYLLSTDIMKGPAASYHVEFTFSHARLATVCLTYVMLNDFDGPCDDYEIRHNTYPFYAYAARYWPEHVSEYQEGNDNTLDQLILDFFHLGSDSKTFQAWRQFYEACHNQDRILMTSQINKQLNQTKWAPTAPLYFAARLGHLQAVRELLELGADISVDGGEFGSPISAVAFDGHKKIMQLLLEKGADPNQSHDKDIYMTPLYLAASKGHAECIKTLLDFGADAESAADKLLFIAFWNSHGDVHDVLVGEKFFKDRGLPDDTEINQTTNLFVTTFVLSAQGGFYNTFRTLIERGKESLFSEPITSPVVELLVEATRRVVNNGHLKLLKTMLHNQNIKAICLRNDIFRVILQEAAYNGRDKIAQLLLNLKKTLGPEILGLSLHLAAANGNPNTIEYLVRAGADPSAEDEDGWSPVICASEYKNHAALEKFSKFVDISKAFDAISRVGPNVWDISPQPESSADGLEIRGDRTVVFRALHPITPGLGSSSYSFEVEVVNLSTQKLSIGFVDGLFSYTFEGSRIYNVEPGMYGKSWGYHRSGMISLDDEMDGQSIQTYGTGDFVGCHFDKIREVAFFTVNGKIAGIPIADIKGKIIPMIQVGEGDHIRTNFGSEPFFNEVPTLTAEIMGNLWRPSPIIHLRPQQGVPNV